MRLSLALCSLLFLTFVPAALATTFYVSPSGSDTNSGTSAALAWKTVAKVNGSGFAAGDIVRFEGGASFTGSLMPKRSVAGTAANQITFTTYGTGVATFSTNASTGLQFNSGHNYLTFQNLKFIGSWLSTETGGGGANGIALTGGTGFVLDNVEVSGYSGHGITGKDNFTNLRIVNCYVHDVGIDGISIGNWGRTATSINNLYIGYTRVHDAKGYVGPAHAGNGIIVGQSTNTLIEYCVAYNNGKGFGASGGGGPVGIWLFESVDSIIQHCESYSNSNGTHNTDGGGFDLDGRCTGCIIQYCYSHDNDGPGFLIAHFDGTGLGSPTNDNTFRYNISQNDSKASWQASGFSAWSADGTQLTNTKVYNNIFYSNKSGKKVVNRESGMGPGNRIYNNIILTTGGAQLVGGAASNFLFQNNLYWAFDGNFKFNGTTITSLDAFRGTSGGQEQLNGAALGMQANPLLNNPGGAGTINDPANMAALLTAYKQQPASPARDAALNLLATFGINPGTKDFYGNALPQGGAWDIGSHEFVTTAPLDAPTGLIATTVSDVSIVSISLSWTDASNNEESFTIESKVGTGVYQFLATRPAGTTSYSVTGLRPATAYSFRVKAANATGVSAWSNIATATTLSSYAAWSAKVNWGTIPVSQRNPLDDPDGDSLANVFELLFGGNPAVADAPVGPAMKSVQVGAKTHATVRFPRANGTNDIAVSILTSTSLDSGSWQDATTSFAMIEDTNDGQFQWRTYRFNTAFSDDLPLRFFRLKAQ